MHVLSSWHWNMALQTVGTEDQVGTLQWQQQIIPVSHGHHRRPFSLVNTAILESPISLVGTDMSDVSEVPRHQSQVGNISPWLSTLRLRTIRAGAEHHYPGALIL